MEKIMLPEKLKHENTTKPYENYNCELIDEN